MARLPSPPLPLLLSLLLLLLLSAHGLDPSSPSLPRFAEVVTLAERESPFPLVNAMGKREERAIPFSSSSPSSSFPEGRKRSQVHQGSSLTFYEHNFEGVFQNYGWNADSPNKILIISGDTPFLSVDTGKTFSNISGRLEGFDVLHQGSYGIRATVRSPADHDYFLFLGKGSNMWQTKDGGETFRAINAQAQGQPLYLRSFQLHPSRRDLLVASQVGSSCPQSPNCPYELYISKDFGETWTLITTHIWSYFWGSYESVTGVRKDSVYALVSSNKSGRQSASDDAEVIEVVVDDNNRVVTVSEHVQQMLAIGEYVYIISNKMELLVSHLGNPFRAVTFYGGELRGFTFMDVSEGSVVLIDTPSSSTGYASSRGDVWISDSTGTHFTRSLTRVVLQAGLGRFDFHKIESLEGTYIATIVDSRGSLWSKISWNRGGSWSDIKSKEVIDGVIDGERSPFVIYGEVHSSTTGTNFGFFSEESAPGLVLAIGHHGVQFVDYVTGEVTKGDVYLSRNGGKTFEKILEGLHYCSLLDEGSAVVCVPGHGEGTSAFLYSLDQGKTWKTEAFIDRPIDIAHLTADPDNFGLAALIFFIENQRVSLVSVDLTELNLPVCQESAYERWMPSDSQNERHCIMGHRSTYVRLKSDAACTSTLNSFLVEQENCPCGLGDFECDVGYFFNATSSSCSPEVGVPVQQIDCQDGHYMKDLNYRLIPGNTCNRTVAEAVNLEEDVKTECPVEHLIADNEFKKKLAIGLGLGMTFLAIVITAALGFVYWSKKKGYLQYRRVRTQEGGAVELEGPDHPEDFDEDNQPIEGSNVPNP